MKMRRPEFWDFVYLAVFLAVFFLIARVSGDMWWWP